MTTERPDAVDVADHGFAERFAAVARSARENLGVAVDLVLVHNEKPVKGAQPRIALNRAIVLGAVTAWESFVADSTHAFGWSADESTEAVFAAGLLGSQSGGSQLGAAIRELSKVNACPADAFDRVSVKAACDWRGVQLRSLETLVGNTPGERSGLTLAQQVSQWIDLRNGLAHGSLRSARRAGDDPEYWLKTATIRSRGRKPNYTDPYEGVNGRWRVWASDAVGRQDEPEHLRMDGGTVQSGSARACLALFIQLIDWFIVEFANERDWGAEALRLPAEWFARRLPQFFRGSDGAEYEHWTLWGSPELYRRVAG